MRFTVTQSALSKALAVVSRGVGNSTVPIISGILVSAAEGMLELQSTNLNISIRDQVAAMVEEAGACVISGRMLSNIVKSLPDSAVTFEGGEGQVTITCERSTFRINTLPAQEFPEFPAVALERSVELPADVLRAMTNHVVRATSKDNSRPILTGILLTVEDNLVQLVATDSYRLAVCDTTVEGTGLADFKMIVPGAALDDVLKLPSDSASILVGASDQQIVFVTGNTTYVSRRIEGNFPSYRSIMPETTSTSVRFGVAELSDVIHRVSVVAQANPSVRLDVDAANGVLTVSASSNDQGEAREEMRVETSGVDCSIALNYRYVFDCLTALKGTDMATVELLSAKQPAVFKSTGKINYLYLLMPVRL